MALVRNPAEKFAVARLVDATVSVMQSPGYSHMHRAPHLGFVSPMDCLPKRTTGEVLVGSAVTILGTSAKSRICFVVEPFVIVFELEGFEWVGTAGITGSTIPAGGG